jgi:hypothetical protein
VVPTGSQVHRDFLHRPVTTSCFNFHPIQLLFLLLACEDFIHACLGQVFTNFFALMPFLLAPLEFLVDSLSTAPGMCQNLIFWVS